MAKPQFKRWYSSQDFSCGTKASIVLVGAGWWSQGWHLPHLHRNEEVTISAIVGERKNCAHQNNMINVSCIFAIHISNPVLLVITIPNNSHLMIVVCSAWYCPRFSNNVNTTLTTTCKVDSSPQPKSNLNPNLESLTALATRYNCPIFHSLTELLQSPIGKSMDTNFIWDGFDMIKSLSKIVDIQ